MAPPCARRPPRAGRRPLPSHPHLFANVVVPVEEAGAEVLLHDIARIGDDELAYAREHDIFDRLGGHALEADHQDGSVAHPVGEGQERTSASVPVPVSVS